MKQHILIVDDDQSMRRLLEYNLGKKFDVTTAEDGQQALDLICDGNKPDLIVADINMPKVDGYGFIQSLHARKGYSHIPVIFLTAKAQSTDRIKGLKLGAEDYVVKPFNPEELVIRIENILRRLSN
ncbi:MAG: response regulator transcription factor [Candidatus Zhuqueibacterota bacterium]